MKSLRYPSQQSLKKRCLLLKIRQTVLFTTNKFKNKCFKIYMYFYSFNIILNDKGHLYHTSWLLFAGFTGSSSSSSSTFWCLWQCSRCGRDPPLPLSSRRAPRIPPPPTPPHPPSSPRLLSTRPPLQRR